jgi:hypothetical protein
MSRCCRTTPRRAATRRQHAVLLLDGGRCAAASLVGIGRPWSHHMDLIASNFLFRDPIAFAFFFLDPIAFNFLFGDLIAFLFLVQGSLCKNFDSQLTQPTKQHLNLACLNTPDLPNM